MGKNSYELFVVALSLVWFAGGATPLSFLSLPFKKTRIFYPYRTPKIPGKEGKNAQKNKEFLAGEKSKEFQKSKGRKDRVLMGFTLGIVGIPLQFCDCIGQLQILNRKTPKSRKSEKNRQ